MLLKVEEAATRISMGKSWVYDQITQNNFPHIRLGRKILIPSERLDQWVEEQIQVPS